MKFILVRHTETDWNREWRLQGFSDTSLNEYGWIGAEDIAKKLKNLGIKKIVSSDLRRSRETASVINNYLDMPIYFDPRLRECNFGTLEGKRREEVLNVYKSTRIDTEGLWHGSLVEYDFSKFGGEDRDRVLRRHLSLLDEFSSFGAGATLLVGHGTGLNTLLTHFKKPRIERGEYSEIEYQI